MHLAVDDALYSLRRLHIHNVERHLVPEERHQVEVCIVVLVDIDGVGRLDELYAAYSLGLLLVYDAYLVWRQRRSAVAYIAYAVVLVDVYHEVGMSCCNLALGSLPLHHAYLMGHVHAFEDMLYELYLEAVGLSPVVDVCKGLEGPVGNDDEGMLLRIAYAEGLHPVYILLQVDVVLLYQRLDVLVAAYVCPQRLLRTDRHGNARRHQRDGDKEGRYVAIDGHCSFLGGRRKHRLQRGRLVKNVIRRLGGW